MNPDNQTNNTSYDVENYPDKTTEVFNVSVRRCDEPVNDKPTWNVRLIVFPMIVVLLIGCGYLYQVFSGEGDARSRVFEVLNLNRPIISISDNTPPTKIDYENSELAEAKKYCYIANCYEWVNLRMYDSLDSDIIGTVNFGEEVEYLREAENGFVMVLCNEGKGFIHSDFLSETKPTERPIRPEFKVIRDKLVNVLEKKQWSEDVNKLLRDVYDMIFTNYDLRYGESGKADYMENIVNTIESIDLITVNPDDEILLANDWGARASYVDNAIVLKYLYENDMRHELAHMEDGSFLIYSNGADLGHVLEEGRASYKEGDVVSDVYYMDNTGYNIFSSGDNKLVLPNGNGTYMSFEYIYSGLMKVGVDLEGIRKRREYCDDAIRSELTEMYGKEYCDEMMSCIYEYIGMFNEHGIFDENSGNNSEAIFTVVEKLDSLFDKGEKIRQN